MFEYTKLRKLLIDDNMCIALVGGGGKTSTMYGLGRIFANENKRVFLTTTTHILMPTSEQCDVFEYSDRLDNVDIPCGKIYTYSSGIVKNNKVSGYDVEILEKAQNTVNKNFDILIYEADGARMLPLKAPNETEPCIASNTTHTIACIGLDSLGKPLNEDTVFRVNLFSNITGCKIDEIIEPKHIQKLLEHENGLFQYTPNLAKKIVLLTKADDEVRIKYANRIKELLINSDNWLGNVLWI